MTTISEVPLVSLPQKLTISLAGTIYQLTLLWRSACGWVMDISDSSGNPIISGIPLVTGADLLEQYAYLGIGGQFWVQSDGDPDAVPAVNNLGDTAHLYFVTEP
jgi:hypothetical protein